MSLIEFLVANLGSAVAKSILKFWAKDSDFAQNAGGEVIDFLKSRVSEGIASRRGNRQFEAIAEDVAESLLPIFAHENLGEEDKKRVAEAVGNILRNLQISAELLVKKNLDPSELSKLISNASVEQKKLLSETECAFYDRLVDECAQYIVDISSQLPNFTEKTFAEVLQRGDEIHNVAKAILKEVREISEKSREVNPESNFARFETEYRRAVARKFDQVELLGVDVSTPSRRHRLSVAYISLSASGKAPSRQTLPSATPTATTHTEQQVDTEVVCQFHHWQQLSLRRRYPLCAWSALGTIIDYLSYLIILSKLFPIPPMLSRSDGALRLIPKEWKILSANGEYR
jgi:hypothetical protein